MTTLTQQLKSHSDKYSCIGINLCHLDDHDRHTLDCGGLGDMVMERSTGWFVKLYEFEESEEREEGETLQSFFKTLYKGITPTLLTIFCEAYTAGYRLIEFDADAMEIEDLPTY